MKSFEEETYARIVAKIRSWDTQQYPDIYALSFLYSTGFCENIEGNEVCIGNGLSVTFNTVSYYLSQIEQASDAEEAKWNYAFWLQNDLATMPQVHEFGYVDPDDWELRQTWLAEQGNDEKSSEALIECYTRIAQRLHHENILVETLGRSVPIIIHNLVYEERGDIATRRANPEALLTEYLAEWA
jgi:hypothetical protein